MRKRMAINIIENLTQHDQPCVLRRLLTLWKAR